MSGFRNIAEVAAADIEGRRTFTAFRKVPNITTQTASWFDFSQTAGNPPAISYFTTPLVARALAYSTHNGIWHGGAVSPARKFIRETMFMAPAANVPTIFILADYLLYYPSIDESTLTEQVMTNSVTLPRLTSGEGVQMIAVAFGARTGGQQFTVRYTNSAGVVGRVTPAVTQCNLSIHGQIVTTTSNAGVQAGSCAPFLPLQYGDTGVRSVQGVTMLGADTGWFALVLVKPITTIHIRGIDAPVENDHWLSKATFPPIEDDACLQFLCLQNATLGNTVYSGTLIAAWN